MSGIKPRKRSTRKSTVMTDVAAEMEDNRIRAFFTIGAERYHMFLDPYTRKLLVPFLYKTNAADRVTRLDANGKRNIKLIQNMLHQLKADGAIEQAIARRHRGEATMARHRHVLRECLRFWTKQMKSAAASPVPNITDGEFVAATRELSNTLETI